MSYLWKKGRNLLGVLLLALSFLLVGCSEDLVGATFVVTGGGQAAESSSNEDTAQQELSEDGEYTSRDDVAAYLNEYEHLPSNFITKKEAKALGWDSKAGNLAEVAPGKSIGGDYFGNYEEILPEEDGRDYHECDIDSDGGYRGAKRIVYSDDGLIYYTEDHYKTFELLYGEE